MNLPDILIVGSIITGLLSIPFLAVGPFSDYIPTGEILLGLNGSDVTKIPSRTSKVLNFERFEKTYETAFGKFHFTMSTDNIIQELSRPGMSVKVIDGPDESIWQLSTHNYMLTITQNSDQTIEQFSSADGSLTRVRENGGVNETFEGFNPEILITGIEEAKITLQSEVEKMEQIKLETVLPELGISPSSSLSNIVINELLPDPDGSPQDYDHSGATSDAGDEFIELYNKGSTSVNLNGWQLTSGSAVLTITDVTISGNSFVYFIAGDKEGDYGTPWSGSWTTLGNSADSISLLDDHGVIMDSYNYSSTSAGVSFGRETNGSPTWTTFSTPTPGSSNG